MKIKSFWGYFKNAVKTRIWIAVFTYLLAANTKKILYTNENLRKILQIPSVFAFDKTPVNELFTNKYKIVLTQITVDFHGMIYNTMTVICTKCKIKKNRQVKK